MSQSSGSTVPFSPGTRASYTDIENAVFANLRPFGEPACKAFDVVGNWIEANPTQSTNARQFFNAQHVSKRATSESLEEIVESTARLAREWVGTYQLRLNQLSTKRLHWILGSGSDEIDRPADLLLAPPSANCAKPRIAYNHAILSFNQDTSRVMLQARHTVMVCSRGAQALRGPEARVIEHDEVLMIGNCVYVFEFTDFAKTRTYEDALVEFMRKRHSSNWSINKHLLPVSVQDPIILGNYFCSPSTFAQGTFGKVAVGWTKGGRGVAIKTFKQPKKTEIATHVRQMKEIGEHVSIKR